MHALIAQNGAGKTTLLNSMVDVIIRRTEETARFMGAETMFGPQTLPPLYFSGVVSVSFSAFDPFTPPAEQTDPTQGSRYSYIGLKDRNDPGGERLKSMPTIASEFVESLKNCLSEPGMTRRWLSMIETLQSDDNFARQDLRQLTELQEQALETESRRIISEMSSGHTIVLLILTRLVETVAEKTLILLDEPESHLHPPLLSAFTRAISELLNNRNGVAIVATHSPVVLQEVPSCCVWKIRRVDNEVMRSRPRIETFGENVSVLTKEIFGLEVQKSGFHALLTKEVAYGLTYDEVITKYEGRLGIEARGLLRVMIAERARTAT